MNCCPIADRSDGLPFSKKSQPEPHGPFPSIPPDPNNSGLTGIWKTRWFWSLLRPQTEWLPFDHPTIPPKAAYPAHGNDPPTAPSVVLVARGLFWLQINLIPLLLRQKTTVPGPDSPESGF